MQERTLKSLETDARERWASACDAKDADADNTGDLAIIALTAYARIRFCRYGLADGIPIEVTLANCDETERLAAEKD